MHRGLLKQVATPADLYEFPNSRFVADFVGSVNMFEGVLEVDQPNHAKVKVKEFDAPVYLDHGVTGAKGANVWVALRPEKIEMHKKPEGAPPMKMEDAPEGANVVAGIVRDIVYLGSETIYEVEIEGGRRVKTFRSNLTRYDQEDFTWDEPVWLAWHACSPAVLLS
jgi:spermidine/putrescine transport system ATP-binding protein